MKKYVLITIIILLAALVAGWLFSSSAYNKTKTANALKNSQDQNQDETNSTFTKLARSVSYKCESGKIISAQYYQGPAPEKPKPGERPKPTGSVKISLNGTATTSLPQTISASGIRYANSDESLVFWSKGPDAFVMRDGETVADYQNCSAIK